MMAGAQAHHDLIASSSSSHSPAFNTPPSAEDRDELDFLDDDALQDIDFDAGRRTTSARGPSPADHDHDGHDHDHAVFDDDPIHGDIGGASFSFKPRPKPSIMSAPGRFLSSLAGGFAGASDQSGNGTPRGQGSRSPDNKDGQASNDWYTEGPGRRVGYEDLTAIDWIFEYTKERQRLRVLGSSASGLMGYAQHLLDASQVWVILLLTGISVGTIAAVINIASDWLSDLKLGYCSSGPEGGHFYLNRNFCCYGYDAGYECDGWKTWGEAVGIAAAGGRWVVEYIFYLILAITFALSASILVQEYAIHAKHSGIPEIKTILGGFVIRRLLGGWTLLTKSLGLILAVASGMWLGKEGPLVHVACCCANIFIKLFSTINNNEARKREVLSAAAASGISVAFGSPIGGVLFSLESLSYYFPDKTMWQSFVCAMAAAVVLQAFDPFRSGKLVLYQTKYSVDWHGFEIVPYAILGILGGIYGGLFIRANMFVARWKKSTSWLPGPILQVLAVALLTALINYPNFYMKVQSTELVSNLFVECAQVLDDPIGLCKTGAASTGTIILLFFAAVLGFFLAAITFGLQIPAGIILPSMAIGALMGRAVGILVELIVQSAPPGFILFQSCKPDVPCITPGTYAIIGASSALAGVTRLTISIVVIMFELTGALTYVLPIMVSVMISKWVGDAFSRRGIYESWIHFNEYPYIDNSDEMVIPDVPASHIMTRIEDLVVLTATGHTIASLNSILESNPYRGFPVISDPRDAIFLGYISRAELSYNLRAATSPPRSLPQETEAFFSHQPLADPRTTLDLRPWMDHTPLTLPSRTNLHLVVSYFQKLGLRYVLFSDRGVLQGLLTKKDVWYVLNGADETRRTAAEGSSATAAARGAGSPRMAGAVREGRGGGAEERGLLREEDDDDDDDARDRESIL